MPQLCRLITAFISFAGLVSLGLYETHGSPEDLQHAANTKPRSSQPRLDQASLQRHQSLHEQPQPSTATPVRFVAKPDRAQNKHATSTNLTFLEKHLTVVVPAGTLLTISMLRQTQIL